MRHENDRHRKILAAKIPNLFGDLWPPAVSTRTQPLKPSFADQEVRYLPPAPVLYVVIARKIWAACLNLYKESGIKRSRCAAGTASAWVRHRVNCATPMQAGGIHSQRNRRHQFRSKSRLPEATPSAHFDDLENFIRKPKSWRRRRHYQYFFTAGLLFLFVDRAAQAG